VQFHPEASPGPRDAAFLFDDFLRLVGAMAGERPRRLSEEPERCTEHTSPRSRAASSSSARAPCRSARPASSTTPARRPSRPSARRGSRPSWSTPTSRRSRRAKASPTRSTCAVTPDFVEKVIVKEEVDAITLSFGGQTALNCGLELDDRGILEKYGVRVLGTPVKAIRDTEDRKLFIERLERDRREDRALARPATPSEARAAVRRSASR
jgi:hypothetical protein